MGACTIDEELSLDIVDHDKITVQSKEVLQKKTVAQLKSDLIYFKVEAKSTRALRKAVLIDLLILKQTEAYQTSIDESIRDTESIALPFEGTLSFRDKSICRIPSLPFAIASLIKAKEVNDNSIPQIDPRNTSYVVDPESNLPETQKKIVPFLESLSEGEGWSWRGVVNNYPKEEFMNSILKKSNGLFLYSGHGGGERFYSRSQIERLMTDENYTNNEINGLSTQLCQSTLVLMGCSSGKLSSINAPKNSCSLNSSIQYEPDGIALSYLCAGSPCVVSNLWDVTDRDIDRYFMTLLNNFLEPITDKDSLKSYSSIAESVAKSRNACKMSYIVGCAPVVYGVPVRIQRE